MEDIKAYIESGILELYVLGDLSDSEKAEVEAMALKHSEVRAELLDIEKSLETYASKNSIEPSERLRSKVLESLKSTPDQEEVEEQEEAQVIPMSPASTSPFYKYAFAASVAILLLSWSSLFVLYNRLQDSRQQIANLQNANQQFATRANYADKQLAEKQVIISVLTNPDFKMIGLKGTELAPEASMLVAFNPKSKEVMIDLASLKMPANDKEHQYQLWALVDGKPVDLGVFDSKLDSTGMIRMKEIGAAQTFAVTLEPKGGSVNPTLTQLMVMGQI